MEPLAQDHIQLRQAAEAAKPTLEKLREERERLVPRLRDIDQTMQLLQGLIEAWERIDRRNDPLVAQLQRIDHELRNVAGAKSADVRHVTYTGVERRANPRPSIIARPLAALPVQAEVPAAPAGMQIRGAVLQRARRILQTGKDRLAKPG